MEKVLFTNYYMNKNSLDILAKKAIQIHYLFNFILFFT